MTDMEKMKAAVILAKAAFKARDDKIAELESRVAELEAMLASNVELAQLAADLEAAAYGNFQASGQP